jgi:hypothetical protein
LRCVAREPTFRIAPPSCIQRRHACHLVAFRRARGGGHRGDQHGERTCAGWHQDLHHDDLVVMQILMPVWVACCACSSLSCAAGCRVRAGIRICITTIRSRPWSRLDKFCFIYKQYASVFMGVDVSVNVPRAKQPCPRLVVSAPVVRPIRVNCGRGALRSSHGQHLSRSHRQHSTSRRSVSLPTQPQKRRDGL